MLRDRQVQIGLTALVVVSLTIYFLPPLIAVLGFPEAVNTFILSAALFLAIYQISQRI
ncbi:MAG: hypothetical protein LH702_15555 [Phormidesmis sp. CAN_BIN44]|nr:hypothetical protein [Phormidesmis sp. CAN_BIN44]